MARLFLYFIYSSRKITENSISRFKKKKNQKSVRTNHNFRFQSWRYNSFNIYHLNPDLFDDFRIIRIFFVKYVWIVYNLKNHTFLTMCIIEKNFRDFPVGRGPTVWETLTYTIAIPSGQWIFVSISKRVTAF